MCGVLGQVAAESVRGTRCFYPQRNACATCSLYAYDVQPAQVFYFAQKAVLHPTAPLYDARDHHLRPACAAALRRVFKVCDKDRDGLLNDGELNEFQVCAGQVESEWMGHRWSSLCAPQRKCFNAPLQQHELEGVKEVVQQAEAGGVIDNALTEDGVCACDLLAFIFSN